MGLMIWYCTVMMYGCWEFEDDTIWWWCSVAKCDFGQVHIVSIMAVSITGANDRNGGKVWTVTFMRQQKRNKMRSSSTKVLLYVDVLMFVVIMCALCGKSACRNWQTGLRWYMPSRKTCGVGATLLVPLIWTLNAITRKLLENPQAKYQLVTFFQVSELLYFSIIYIGRYIHIIRYINWVISQCLGSCHDLSFVRSPLAPGLGAVNFLRWLKMNARPGHAWGAGCSRCLKMLRKPSPQKIP